MGRKKSKIFLCGAAAVLAVSFAGLSGTAKETEIGLQETEAQEAVQILFFHNTACGSCDGTEEFRQAVEEQISYYKEEYPYELQMYNVFQTTGMQEWEKTAAEYDLENEEYIYPVMVLDGIMYKGMNEIKEQLHKAFLEACGVSAVYFYREDCEECQDMASFWDSFPEEFQIAELESRMGDNGTQIRRLFEEYQVPDEDQMVPFVFLKDTYLAGQESIEENLQKMLEGGEEF